MNPESGDAHSQPGSPDDSSSEPKKNPAPAPGNQDDLDYEVIQPPIGKGSYGEVYLAKTRDGSYCAVKIVYRVTFDDERPYEREYEGIVKFEPISRLSESQLQIRRVGRRDHLGYFYYIMELADDAAGVVPIDPATYVPRTLRSDLARRGRLSARECCQIGHTLATGVENLHQHDKIHRDIKPANIIFVGGKPKLADPGLVTDSDQTMTRVGTEAYIPPEGPGSTLADIYALGMVLYEAFTGFKRSEYPRLPPDFEELSDHGIRLQLKRIINRACEGNYRRRYQSARDLRLDLERLLTLGSGAKNRENSSAGGKAFRWAIAFVLLAAIAVFSFSLFRPAKNSSPPSLQQGVSARQETHPLEQWTNSLGMVFVSVPGTKASFCIWETRLRDFEAFVNATGYSAVSDMLTASNNGWRARGHTWRDPGFNQSPLYPVCGVNWDDAHAFCKWLTSNEVAAGIIRTNQYYRLPTDVEWSAAVNPPAFNRPLPVSPVDKDGRKLNLDFSDGTLHDWTATGNAFDDQPVSAKEAAATGFPQTNSRAGNHWIISCLKKSTNGPDPEGTLTSVPFTVTKPYASFLMFGNPAKETRVELREVTSDKPFFSVCGMDEGNLVPIVVDLQSHMGHDICICLFSAAKKGWQQLGFADFKFYETEPQFTDSYHPWGNDFPPPKGSGNFAGVEVWGKNWPRSSFYLIRHRDGYARTAPVATFAANRLGIYDLAGNVAEWCEDYYTIDLNREEYLNARKNLMSDGGGKTYRVVRGGSWSQGPIPDLRSDLRQREVADLRRDNIGFRCVLVRGGN